jgi:hypothetical protein
MSRLLLLYRGRGLLGVSADDRPPCRSWKFRRGLGFRSGFGASESETTSILGAGLQGKQNGPYPELTSVALRQVVAMHPLYLYSAMCDMNLPTLSCGRWASAPTSQESYTDCTN